MKNATLKKLKVTLLGLSLVFITETSLAYTAFNAFEAVGETPVSEPFTLSNQTEKNAESTVAASVTEIPSLGIAVLYNPKLFLERSWPKRFQRKELLFASAPSSQLNICVSLGYSQALTNEAKTTSMLYSGRLVADNFKVNDNREVTANFVSIKKGGQSGREQMEKQPHVVNVLSRIVCRK